jgi:hypothetical protein
MIWGRKNSEIFSKATVHQYTSPVSFLLRCKSVLWRTQDTTMFTPWQKGFCSCDLGA